MAQDFNAGGPTRLVVSQPSTQADLQYLESLPAHRK